ncbi:MAG: transglutaminase-like domain-containing protein [Planctomycetota bacterium]
MSLAACRPLAYQTLAQQMEDVETTQGLLRAAIAISMHEWPDTNVAEVERAIGSLASRIRSRVHGAGRSALLAHLHEEFFEKQGFRGAKRNYYAAENSYLPGVLARKRGIPISLSLIYCVVARRIGLRADGINAPGHFLVQVQDDNSPILVDVFNGGRMLTRDDALQLVRETTGDDVSCASALRPATHRQWLQRMLHNLMLVFEMQERHTDALAMREMLALLK